MFSSFSKKSIVLSTVVVLSLGLVGCGSSGSSSSGTTTSTAKTGIFADAPVEGLSYKTATQSGFTDAQGHFKYKDGETVEFKLGTLLLGKSKAGAFLTPYSISDNNTTVATNIAMVLQNFDGNRSNTQVLNLSKFKDVNFSAGVNTRNINIDAAPSALQSKLATLLATASFQKYVDDVKHNLIIDVKAKKNMDDYIHKYETEHSKVTTPITQVSGKYADFSKRKQIVIDTNEMTSVVFQSKNIFDTSGYYTNEISAYLPSNTSVTCKALGFTVQPTKKYAKGSAKIPYYEYQQNGKVCDETNYTGTVLAGNSNLIVGFDKYTYQPTTNGSQPTTNGSQPTTNGSQPLYTTITNNGNDITFQWKRTGKALAYGIHTDLVVVNSNGQAYPIAHTNSDEEITINCKKKNQDFTCHASNEPSIASYNEQMYIKGSVNVVERGYYANTNYGQVELATIIPNGSGSYTVK